MTRIEFMSQLDELLKDITDSERADALTYYNDYFDDAGAECEGDVIEELVSPQKVAQIIKADLSEHGEETMEYTETGYKDSRFDEKAKVPETRENFEKNTEKNSEECQKEEYQRESFQREERQKEEYQRKEQQRDYSRNDQRNQRKSMNIGLIILLCIFAIPIGIPMAAAAFGLLMGFAGVLIGLSAALIGIVAALYASGIIFVAVGAAKMIAIPATGLLVIGMGLMMLALAVILTLGVVGFAGKVLPGLIRGITAFIGRIFHRGGSAI
jgi:uncharacterized membrane protein